MRSIVELNALDAPTFVAEMAPMFEGAPTFLASLAEARPFESDEDLFDSARVVARELAREAQVELLDAHPRIGAEPDAISRHSRQEQGFDSAQEPDDQAWVANELQALNEAYESRFGFRFVVFVAGRPRAEMIPLLERALHAEPEEELRRGLDDVVLIAADRMHVERGPEPMREELREAIALEVSRFMVGELDRDALLHATHRLIEQGVESPALLAASLAAEDPDAVLDAPIAGLMSEIGLAGWDASQAGQLLALHAAASVIGEVSQPIDGARRIVSVSANPEFRDLVARWEADPERRDAIDGEIRRAAAELFGPPDDPPEERSEETEA
ncbi:MAG TPA: 2-oxo-4-hydroxy-4-carboxy-5-ureidoimidazoline decarboxylase [Candidatus Limnocylindria bacterium]|nr:2-oxo-4-hydroxy-4-carboxy-5-ureidoimidazoline decarboxylase [Candidatus Limnocylindria bacterium]